MATILSSLFWLFSSNPMKPGDLKESFDLWSIEEEDFVSYWPLLTLRNRTFESLWLHYSTEWTLSFMERHPCMPHMHVSQKFALYLSLDFKGSSSYCVMWYFWWGCRGNLKLITLGRDSRKSVFCTLSKCETWSLWNHLLADHASVRCRSNIGSTLVRGRSCVDRLLYDRRKENLDWLSTNIQSVLIGAMTKFDRRLTIGWQSAACRATSNDLVIWVHSATIDRQSVDTPPTLGVRTESVDRRPTVGRERRPAVDWHVTDATNIMRNPVRHAVGYQSCRQ